MSRDARVRFDFGGDEREFRLGYGELIRLQEELDCGPWYMLGLFGGLARFRANPAAVRELSVRMCREIIRVGLEGGGMKPPEALRLVRDYVERRPPDEYVGVAFGVLAAALSGAPDDDEVKKKEGANASIASPEASFASPASSAPEQPSASRPRKSKKRASGSSTAR